jgi:hypothetical protein
MTLPKELLTAADVPYSMARSVADLAGHGHEVKPSTRHGGAPGFMVTAILVIARQDGENATPTRTAHGHSEQICLMARAGATAAGAAALSSRRAEWADAIPHP